MSLVDALLSRLAEPEVAGLAVDELERFQAHRAVLARKPLIRDVFAEFHREMRLLDDTLLSGSGKRVELGAGVFPVRETYPDVVATDVVPASHLDGVVDACRMNFPDESVRSFYLQNVFHHIPNPSLFFSELERVLQPGGGALIIEPHSGPVASLIYPKLFRTERYDKDDRSWLATMSGPMSGANQALSYIVFDRDVQRFKAEHPRLDVVHRDVLVNGVRYLVSGGLNFRALIPSFAVGGVRIVERLLAPSRRILGLHRVIVLRKRV